MNEQSLSPEMSAKLEVAQLISCAASFLDPEGSSRNAHVRNSFYVHCTDSYQGARYIISLAFSGSAFETEAGFSVCKEIDGPCMNVVTYGMNVFTGRKVQSDYEADENLMYMEVGNTGMLIDPIVQSRLAHNYLNGGEISKIEEYINGLDRDEVIQVLRDFIEYKQLMSQSEPREDKYDKLYLS